MSHNCAHILIKYHLTHWRIQGGGAAGTRPPQQDQFFLFLHMF